MPTPTPVPDIHTVQGVLDVANYAAGQSDRWMFVAMLIIFILSVAWMVKYFTQQLDKANSRLTEISDKFSASLIETSKETVAALKETAVVLKSNYSVMERVIVKLDSLK